MDTLCSRINEVENELKIVRNYLEEKYKKNVSIGISKRIKSFKECKNAYFEAKKTLSLASDKRDFGIFSFSDYSLELLFLNVEEELVDSFISEVLGSLSHEEICGFEELLRVYIENNTSLNGASKQLFIHKNTLQYRLNKIQELTGYNPRNTLELYKLFTAINLYSKNKTYMLGTDETKKI